MSGTDLGYAATRGASSLSSTTRYAPLSAYAHATRCPVLTYDVRCYRSTALSPTPRSSWICTRTRYLLRACYAMPGTDVERMVLSAYCVVFVSANAPPTRCPGIMTAYDAMPYHDSPRYRAVSRYRVLRRRTLLWRMLLRADTVGCSTAVLTCYYAPTLGTLHLRYRPTRPPEHDPEISTAPRTVPGAVPLKGLYLYPRRWQCDHKNWSCYAHVTGTDVRFRTTQLPMYWPELCSYGTTIPVQKCALPLLVLTCAMLLQLSLNLPRVLVGRLVWPYPIAYAVLRRCLRSTDVPYGATRY
eukprot:3934832-Rhodomonas_salina.5